MATGRHHVAFGQADSDDLLVVTAGHRLRIGRPPCRGRHARPSDPHLSAASPKAIFSPHERRRLHGRHRRQPQRRLRVAKRVSRMMKGRWGHDLHLLDRRSRWPGRSGQLRREQGRPDRHGEVLAKEFASRGITANVVCPGPIETDMLAALTDAQRCDARRGRSAARPGRRIAAAVEFLASDSAAYITGTVLPVDGGYSMG